MLIDVKPETYNLLTDKVDLLSRCHFFCLFTKIRSVFFLMAFRRLNNLVRKNFKDESGLK